MAIIGDSLQEVIDALDNYHGNKRESRRREMAEATEQHVDLYEMVLYQRGIMTMEDVCPRCKGLGVHLYRTERTWRGDLGKTVPTRDICEVCWGSGNNKVSWPSRYEFEEVLQVYAETIEKGYAVAKELEEIDAGVREFEGCGVDKP